MEGVQAIAYAFNSASGSTADPALFFRGVYGIKGQDKFNFEWGCTGCTGYGITESAHHIRFREMYEEVKYLGRTHQMAMFMNTTLVVHELLHAFENSMKITLGDGRWYKEARSTLPNNFSRDGMRNSPVWTWQQSTDTGAGEIFADMGIGWVYGQWNTEFPLLAAQMSEWMNAYMPHFINVALKNQR